MSNGFPTPAPAVQRDAIGIGLLALGVIVLLFGVAWAWNAGLLSPTPLGPTPLDPNTGAPAIKVPIYGQASIQWQKFKIGSNLHISDVDLRQTQAFSIALPLFLGTGDIKCTAELIDAHSNSIYSQQKILDPFGGITQSDRETYDFTLIGHKGQSYTVKVQCTDLANAENTDTKTRSITTL